jgi:hypothetical protein
MGESPLISSARFLPLASISLKISKKNKERTGIFYRAFAKINSKD